MQTNKSVFKSLLTSNNQTPLMKVFEELIRQNCDDLIPYIEIIHNFSNPDLCIANLLPYLAKELGVENWDESWHENQKRQVCANAILVNRHKGTIGALKRALSSLNLSTEIIEWWQKKPQGVPMTAEVILHEQDIIYSEEQYKVIRAVIDSVKRLALHLTLSKETPISKRVYVGCSYNQTMKMRIENA